MHFPLLPLLVVSVFLVSCGGSSERTEPPPQALSNPKNVTAVPGAGKVTIKWNEVAGATSYNIYFSNAKGVDPKNAAKIGGVKAPVYEHRGLANGVTYFYVVSAVNAKGEGPPSGEMGGTPRGEAPGQPAGVVASLAGEGVVTVKWEPVPAATLYRVYFADRPGMAKAKGTQETVSTNAFTHTGLTGGGYYYYVVAAFNDSGEGPVSRESGVSLKVVLPGQPANAAVTAYPDKITVKWDKVADALSYNVYVFKTEAFSKSGATKVNVTSTSYEHTGLTKGDRYFYVVTAVNSSGEGRESNKVGAKI